MIIEKFISKNLSQTFYLVIENEILHIKHVNKNISKSFLAKIALKNDIVFKIGDEVRGVSEKDVDIFSPFNIDRIVLDNLFYSAAIIRYALQSFYNGKSFFRFNILFHIDKKKGYILTDSEEFLLKELSKQVGAIGFGISKESLLSDEEVFKYKFEIFD